ncbi:DUF1885 family protein [Fredinandcohnia quinoae]|uniref:DUF1885 family protein n=1 Tax=Fredinandcohnia quinoae TaxID=2918902 RepID=A0AAW5DTG9_9BACI|nr:DUF1885 family protein [Fredinandcohnia sp. SECRCQ15]MCH1623941.1 DUF1885 family protein [Fredinandcohnia sp. SECRCQ15]
MENAYIKLVSASNKQSMTLNDVKELFNYYKEITSKTGTQLDWEYAETAFPYQIKEVDTENNWLYLKSNEPKYNAIIVGVGKELIEDDNVDDPQEQFYIQVTLPQVATYGDKGKANEFCKFLGKKLEGELHLFNGRVMYYYKRK